MFLQQPWLEEDLKNSGIVTEGEVLQTAGDVIWALAGDENNVFSEAPQKPFGNADDVFTAPQDADEQRLKSFSVVGKRPRVLATHSAAISQPHQFEHKTQKKTAGQT